MKNYDPATLAKLDQLAEQFDNVEIGYVELRQKERAIKAEAVSIATRWNWRLGIGALIGIVLLCYAFVPRYSVAPAATELGAYVLNTSTGDIYRCRGYNESFACEKALYPSQDSQ